MFVNVNLPAFKRNIVENIKTVVIGQFAIKTFAADVLFLLPLNTFLLFFMLLLLLSNTTLDFLSGPMCVSGLKAFPVNILSVLGHDPLLGSGSMPMARQIAP